MVKRKKKKSKKSVKILPLPNKEWFDFGDLFLHYLSTKHEVARRKLNPYIEIGKNTYISTGVIIGETDRSGILSVLGRDCIKPMEGHVIIGANCIIQGGTIIHKDVKIRDEVYIGNQCIIHSGAIIGKGAKIAERSVVRKNAIIQDNSYYDGSAVYSEDDFPKTEPNCAGFNCDEDHKKEGGDISKYEKAGEYMDGVKL